MLFDDTYKTLKTSSEGIFRDKGSKFIAYAFPIKSDSEVKPLVAQLQLTHPKARHFCWALRLTPDRNVFRINDDGEPSGTAGRPILNMLLSYELTDVLVVVVRYFGGTLLGVPGLINAYKTATLATIEENVIITKTVNDVYEIMFAYLQMNSVMRIVKEEQLSILTQDFGNACSMRFEVRKQNLNVVLSKLEKLETLEIKYITTS